MEIVPTTSPDPLDLSLLAKELAPGDELLLASGARAQVTRVAIQDAPAGEPFTTYNFEVEHDHTYHVGALGVCVHNSSDVPWPNSIGGRTVLGQVQYCSAR